jgi:hypothetical protein
VNLFIDHAPLILIFATISESRARGGVGKTQKSALPVNILIRLLGGFAYCLDTLLSQFAVDPQETVYRRLGGIGWDLTGKFRKLPIQKQI